MKSTLEKISKLLVPGGSSFHHFITSKMVIPKFTNPESTRIGIYFPGGRVWPAIELTRHENDLEFVQSWFINGLNYWRTLGDWQNRYWKELLLLGSSYSLEKDIKHWNEYFSLCKAVFAPLNGEVYGNSHYLFRKPS